MRSFRVTSRVQQDMDELTPFTFFFQNVLGRSSSVVYAVALLASGQSTTISCTFAGQVIMQVISVLEKHVQVTRSYQVFKNVPINQLPLFLCFQGFLDMKMKNWVRNLITRFIAIAPSLIVSIVSGPSGAGKLIIFSSVRTEIPQPTTTLITGHRVYTRTLTVIPPS